MGDKVLYLWCLPSPLEAGPDSSVALGPGSGIPRPPLGPPVWLPMLQGGAPLHPFLQELQEEQVPGFPGRSTRPGAWAASLGAAGHSRRRSPHSDWLGRCWTSWHAACCSGGPGQVVPAPQRHRPPWEAPPEAWPGRPLFDCWCPLSPSAAPSAGARAGHRPWSPGERSCRQLPAPAVVSRGPRKSRRHTGLRGTPGSAGFVSLA